MSVDRYGAQLAACRDATAVVIYPLVRRQSEVVSLGYVAALIMESVFAAVGIISIISVVSVVDALSYPGVDPVRWTVCRLGRFRLVEHLRLIGDRR